MHDNFISNIVIEVAAGQASNSTPDPLAELGSEIRNLRKARELTLEQLSVACGRSVSFLSKIERGVSRPSLTALQDIAEALSVQIGWFFDETDQPPVGERPYIVRSTRRRRLTYSEMSTTDYLGFEDHLLSATLDGELAIGMSRYHPGGSTGDDMQSHEGEEAGLLIDGSIQLTIDDEVFTLEAGDSFSFASHIPHCYANCSDSDAVIVWANTPVSLRQK